MQSCGSSLHMIPRYRFFLFQHKPTSWGAREEIQDLPLLCSSPHLLKATRRSIIFLYFSPLSNICLHSNFLIALIAYPSHSLLQGQITLCTPFFHSLSPFNHPLSQYSPVPFQTLELNSVVRLYMICLSFSGLTLCPVLLSLTLPFQMGSDALGSHI